jgi:hypothetical protein
VTETHEAVWVHKVGSFLLGRSDALDDGWTKNGQLLKFAILNMTTTRTVFGIGLVWGKRMYTLYRVK